MKRKLIMIVAAVFMATSITGYAAIDAPKVQASLAVQKVGTMDAKVIADKLNIRQGPSTSFPVIRKLSKGQSLKVLGKLGNWYAVYDTKNGCIGAVDGKYIKLGGAAQASAGIDGEPDNAVVAPADISKDEQALLDLVNKARKEAGVPELVLDKDLLKTARIKAKDMVDNNYFSHKSPTLGNPFDMMKANGISFKSAGENIAGNQTIEGAFKAWMSSDGHKKNILNTSFNKIGIGITESKTYGKVFVQQFIGK